MKKKNLIGLAIVVTAIALLLETGILNYVNERNASMTSQVLLDRVISIIDKNETSEAQLIDSLKDDYIVRAKAVSYIIDAKPEVEYDVDELQKIAKLMSIDEIHIFNEKVSFTVVQFLNIMDILLIPGSKYPILKTC